MENARHPGKGIHEREYEQKERCTRGAYVWVENMQTKQCSNGIKKELQTYGKTCNEYIKIHNILKELLNNPKLLVIKERY